MTFSQWSLVSFQTVCYCHCRELWDGPRAGPDGAVEFLGVDEVGKGKGGREGERISEGRRKASSKY